MENKKIPRTERILSVYHLFMHCQEVSCKEITDLMPSVSSKTIFRDIKLLRDAGVLRTKYSKKVQAFIPLNVGNIANPVYPEKKRQQIFLKKIRRLCILMNEMTAGLDGFCDEKPLHMELHKKLFPKVSQRTRQRDFKVLGNIGYSVRRFEQDFDDENAEDGFVWKWVYSFECPGTYCLNTFTEKGW